MRITFLTRITITLVILVISISCFFNVVKTNLEKTYQDLTLVQTKGIVTKIVNQVVMDNLLGEDVNLKYSQEEYVSYDVNQINTLISSLSSQVVKVLEDINHSKYQDLVNQELSDKYNASGIIYEIEFGKIFNNFLLSSIGSKFPIKFRLASDVLATCDMDIEEFGINNALVSLNMLLMFDFSLILPYSTKLEQIEIKVPLSLLLIEGEVPSYLYGNHFVEGVNTYLVEVEEI